jgi:hypothetical protein
MKAVRYVEEYLKRAETLKDHLSSQGKKRGRSAIGAKLAALQGPVAESESISRTDILVS